MNLKQYKWIFDINGFWYKRISVFRNIKEEPPHVAHLNSWRNCTFRCHWLCSKEDLLLNPFSMLPDHWHCPPSLIGTSFHCSGSSSQCILLISGKYLMKCWVFFYFLKLIFLIIISWVPESELTNNLYQAAWNNSRSTLTQTNTTEITLIPHVLTSGKQK